MAAKLPSRIPTTPDLPDKSQLTVSKQLVMTEAHDVELMHFTGGSCQGQKSAQVKIRESVMTSFDLTDTQLDFVEVTDIIFENCDLANAEWNWFASNRAIFSQCRLLGFKAIDSEFLSTQFDNCQMQLSQFRFAKMAGAYFEDCNLREADFSGADLTGASFVRCDLTSASFAEGKCRGLDLRSSTLDGLTVGPAEMAGVIINPFQAADMIKVFGVTVLDANKPLS